MNCRALTIFLLCCWSIPHGAGVPDAETPEERAKRDSKEAQYKEIETNLDTLKTTIESALKDNKESTEKAQGILHTIGDLKTNLRSKVKEGDIGALGTATSSVCSAIYKIQGSDDPYEVAQAITDTLGTVSGMLPPPVGPAVSTVLSMVSAFLGLGIKQTPKVQEIVQAIVQKAIDADHLKDLNEEVNGAKLMFSQSVEILLVYEGYDWAKSETFQRQNDMMFLGQQVKITEGLPLLGKLEHYINTEVEKMRVKVTQREITSNNVVAKETVEKFLKSVEGYAQLFALRQSILHSMRSVYSSAQGTILADQAIRRLFEVSALHAENFLKFLHYPSEETIFFMTSGAMKKDSPLNRALKGLGIHVRRDTILGENGEKVCGYIESSFRKLGNNKFWKFARTEVQLVSKSQRDKFEFTSMKDGGVAIRQRGSSTAQCDTNVARSSLYYRFGHPCSLASLSVIRIYKGTHDGSYFMATTSGDSRVKALERGIVGFDHDWVNPGEDTFFKIEKTAC